MQLGGTWHQLCHHVPFVDRMWAFDLWYSPCQTFKAPNVTKVTWKDSHGYFYCYPSLFSCAPKYIQLYLLSDSYMIRKCRKQRLAGIWKWTIGNACCAMWNKARMLLFYLHPDAEFGSVGVTHRYSPFEISFNASSKESVRRPKRGKGNFVFERQASYYEMQCSFRKCS